MVFVPVPISFTTSTEEASPSEEMVVSDPPAVVDAPAADDATVVEVFVELPDELHAVVIPNDVNATKPTATIRARMTIPFKRKRSDGFDLPTIRDRQSTRQVTV